MAALLGIDELNTPKVEVEEPEKYFSKMAISKEQKEERVDTSKEISDVLLFFFALLAIEMQENNPDYDMVLRKFRVRFADVVASHSRMDDHQNAYVDEFTQNQFDITRRHMEAVGVGVDGQTDAGWWTSPDRATAIGEDAANTILNYEELMQAAEAGAVGKKWVDRDDGRVRKTHKEVTKRIIPLAEYFAVGNGVMLYPCDWDNNPDECHRCRCSCHYYDKDGKVVKIVAHYNGQVVKSNDGLEYEESRVVGETDIDRKNVNFASYRGKFSKLGEDEDVQTMLVNRSMEILTHRNGTRYEDLAYIDTVNHKSDINKDYDYYDGVTSACQPSESMEWLRVNAPKNTVISIHNHPGSTSPSFSDLWAAQRRRYKYGLVLGHNGNIFKYSVKEDIDLFGVNFYTYNRLVKEMKEAVKDIEKNAEKLDLIISEFEKYGISMEILK